MGPDPILRPLSFVTILRVRHRSRTETWIHEVPVDRLSFTPTDTESNSKKVTTRIEKISFSPTQWKHGCGGGRRRHTVSRTVSVRARRKLRDLESPYFDLCEIRKRPRRYSFMVPVPPYLLSLSKRVSKPRMGTF